MKSIDAKVENLQVLMDRILVLPVMEVDKLKEMGVEIPDSQKNIDNKGNRSMSLRKATVINVGPGKDGKPVNVKEGDVVYLFPTTMEADIIIDDVLYLIFREQSIVLKEVKNNTTVEKTNKKIILN